MNRRQCIGLSLTAAAAAATGCRVTGDSSPSARLGAKRGIGIAAGKDLEWQRKLQLCGASWFYSWSKNLPDNIPDGAEFVPMIFGRMKGETITKAGEIFRGNKLKQVLGFNEPDQKNQSNVTVEQALNLWPKLMELDMRLGSPGCVHPDREWMKDFMKGQGSFFCTQGRW